jgi:hypothetical protein
VAVDDAEFKDFFASHYARLCWLGLLLTGRPAQAEDGPRSPRASLLALEASRPA